MKRIAGAFVLLFTIVLAIALTLLTLVGTDASMSDREIYLRVAIAILSSAGVTGVSIMLYKALVITIPRLSKHLLSWIVLRTVRKALTSQTGTVESTSIGSADGSVVVRLAIGAQERVRLGHKFSVVNAANGEAWGVLEAYEVHESYCLCSVFDRINTSFWDNLETRMQYDASPPQGVTIRSQIREEALFEWLSVLLRIWRE